MKIVTRSILIKLSYLFFRNHGLGRNCSLSRAHHSQVLQHTWQSCEDYATIHHNKSDEVDGVSVVDLPSSKKHLPEKGSRRHMEFAIITILYLAGFLGVGFCFFQLAGILDRLTYQDQTIESNKVWIWRSLFIIMDIEYAIQILVSLLIISVGLLILLSVMICSSYYQTLPSLIRQRNEKDKEIKQSN